MRLSRYFYIIGLPSLALCMLQTSCNSSSEASATNAFDDAGGYVPDGSKPNSDGGGGAKDAGDSGLIDPDSGVVGCPDCKSDNTGVGSTKPYKPKTDNSSHVGLDPNGALVLDRTATGNPNLIWIANTGQNTVLKVDTNTFKELGRYRTGSGDPSRTSVDSHGNVFVGNRTGQSLTHISADGASCPDTNKDGKITTSTGAGNLLAAGQDDCVLWETPLGGDIRGVAAQDITKLVQTDPDLPPTTEIHRYVWAGGLHGKLYKLDAATGTILITMQSPAPIYGLALDGNGQLWISSGATDVGRVDTTKCIDKASCAATVCETKCAADGTCTDVSTACDAAVLQRIAMPDSMYGITVDFKQRVWLGGGKGLKRYDPHLPGPAGRLKLSTNGFSHGVTADAKGFIYGAAAPNIVRMNGDTMEFVVIKTGGSKGMAVDTAGKVWDITQGDSAIVLTPGADINTNPIQTAVTGLSGPYTYSDMTGLQASLASNDPGYYRQVFEGCKADEETTWHELKWSAVVPKDTTVTFRARTAATEATLPAAKWVSMAVIPSDVPPVDMIKKFLAASVKPQRYLELEVWLGISKQDPTGKLTPVVKSFAVSHSCPSIVQ